MRVFDHAYFINSVHVNQQSYLLLFYFGGSFHFGQSIGQWSDLSRICEILLNWLK